MKQIKNHKCDKINVSAPQQPVVVAVVVCVLRENIVNSFPIPKMVRTIFVYTRKCWQIHSSEWQKNSITNDYSPQEYGVSTLKIEFSLSLALSSCTTGVDAPLFVG